MTVNTPLVVDRGSADKVAAETVLRLKAKHEAAARTFDPLLGETFEEAVSKREAIRADLGEYVEFVYGLEPQRHHRLWIELIHGLIAGQLTEAAHRLGLLPADDHRRRNKLLLLAPPNSGKSLYVSNALTAWYLGKYPDRNVLLFTSSDPIALQFSNTLKLTIEQDKKYRAVFPERESRPNRSRGWSGDGLYLQATPMSGQSPAYRAAGWGASVMGNRADLLIMDDPQNQQDAESAIEQAKAKRYYDMTVEPRLQPDVGAVLGIMTRWAELDLSSHFIQKAKDSGDWLVVALPMVADPGSETPDPLGRAPGELLWPDRFPRSHVDAIRRSMGTAQFAATYQCSAAQLAGDVFADERWFKPLPRDFYAPGSDGRSLRDQLLLFQGVDVAFSEKDRACFTVILTLGVDRSFNCYVLDVRRSRMTVGQTEDALVEQIGLFHPVVVGIEDTAFKHAVTRDLLRRIRSRVMANIRAVAPRGMTKGTSDKVARARLPAARAEHGQMFADKDAAWWPSFISEVLAFPNGANTDQVDALSLATFMPTTFEGKDRRPRRITYNPD